MSKHKKFKPEILHPELERQLPAKPAIVPSVEELNRLMERMLAHERRRARREFAVIIAGIAVLFTLILAGGAWFTQGLLRQLQEERQISERSRADLMDLLHAGRQPAPDQDARTASTLPAPSDIVPPPSASGAPAPAAIATTAVSATPAAAVPPNPVPVTGSFRKSLEVKAAGGLTLRLPIPPPP